MRECARQVPFHQIPPKSHATHIPSSGKVHQDIRFASFALSAGSSVKQNRRENFKKVLTFLLSGGIVIQQLPKTVGAVKRKD